MRCEHCGRNEATFHYQSTVNGYTEEVHLCPECAAALGYRERLAGRMADPFSDVFESAFFVLPSMLGGAFSGPHLTPVARRATTQPTPVSGGPYYEAESLLDEAEGQALRCERKRNSLRFRLQEAIDAEDYEQAARLRDELKQLEERS